jgi:4-hydroxybenzoate polyprenyltransferase
MARRSAPGPASSPADAIELRVSPSTESVLRALLRATRPKQWAKNAVVGLALVFSIRLAWLPRHPETWVPLLARTGLAFIAFSLVSAAEYLINDLRDLEADRLHPRKRLRPLAAGTLRPSLAVAAAIVLGAGGLVLGALLEWRFGLLLLSYALITLAYSFRLKHIVIVDVLTISIGFVLRAAGGALVIGVPISPWLYLCTILGALFLATTKRRHELLLLGEESGAHRAALDDYSPQLLDQMTSIVTAATVVAYSLYTVTAENLPANHAMLATLPFVLYGVFRYLFLVYSRDDGGSPEEVLLRDRPLLADIILWLVSAGVILLVFR